jgi:DNA-binding HxlR family transcriptional regulator
MGTNVLPHWDVSRWDVYDPSCPTRILLDRIGDRWTVLIVSALSREGRMRFSALRNRVGATGKVLTQSLRALERDGIVTRDVYAEVPPRVEYELTALGTLLQEPILALKDWAETHIAEVLEARTRSDGAKAAD